MKINWSKKTIDAGFLPFAVDVKMSIRSVILFILFGMPCHPYPDFCTDPRTVQLRGWEAVSGLLDQLGTQKVTGGERVWLAF